MINRSRWLAAGLASVSLVLPAVSPAQASTAARAKAYLLGAQNADGGFGKERGEKSDPSLTGWAALGLAAAGRSPLQESAQGSSTISYLRSQPRARDAGALARTLLVLEAAGLPTRFAGRDLHTDLMRHRRPDGSFGGLVNLTAFGILATSNANDPEQVLSNQQSASWLTQQQNADGGFSYLPGGESGVDDTAAVLQALVATGMREAPPAEAAVNYLLAAQLATGGFASTHSRSPTAANSMSTAWALQALIAAGLDPRQIAREGRTPIEYLKSLQDPDGSIRYSRTQNHNPVWATAQALPALTERPFPLPRVPVKPAQPKPDQQSPAPSYETDEAPLEERGNARPQRASAEKHAGDAVRVAKPNEETASGSPPRRLRARAPSGAGRDSSFSPAERRSNRAQAHPVPENAGAAGSEVEPANGGLVVALVLAALAALAWWRRARSSGSPPAIAPGPEDPTPSGDEVEPGPVNDLDRELAELLAGQSLQKSRASDPGTERDRTLEPH